jgi:hypothetical protein
MARELDGQVAREAIGAFDQDAAHTVAGDPVEHGLEAGALGHGISERRPTTTCAGVKQVLEMTSEKRRQKMSEADNLEKLRGHFVSARRQEVARVMRSKRPSVVTARRLKATQDIIDALDRAIVDENRLHPPPVEQPEIGTA